MMNREVFQVVITSFAVVFLCSGYAIGRAFSQHSKKTEITVAVILTALVFASVIFSQIW